MDTKQLDFLYGLREYQTLLSLGIIGEEEAVKLSRAFDFLRAYRASGRLLDVMAYPYFLAALLSRFSDFAVDTVFRWEDGALCPTGFHRGVTTGKGEKISFPSLTFHIEHEHFPVPDETYDGALLYEALHYLTENPSFVLAELHRVLRKGGFLFLSTPNALSASNILKLFRGENIYPPYSGLGLRGTLCREFSRAEVKELLEAHHFKVTESAPQDVKPFNTLQRRVFSSLKELLVNLFPGAPKEEHHDHLFIIAEKEGERAYAFPRGIYSSESEEEEACGIVPSLPPAVAAHRAFLLDFVEAGFNDGIQLGEGWHGGEYSGFHYRWAGSSGEVYLRASLPLRLLSLELIIPVIEGEAAVPRLATGKGEALHLLHFSRREAFQDRYHMVLLLPESRDTLRKIVITAGKTYVPREVDPSSEDRRILGIALVAMRLFRGDRLTMGENEPLLLGEGWGPLECAPPSVRPLKDRASVTLYPGGGETALMITCRRSGSADGPLMLHVHADGHEMEKGLAAGKEWQTLAFLFPEPLEERFEDPLKVTLSLPGEESRGDGLEISALGLEKVPPAADRQVQ
ncbi:MAG: methyltransferase domain-containing protein [Candidatus Eremiobacteraeota bacterium]|nr:methyltransferase domain-containing protein [Candidatus Eremiobacteraeota bacterium]